MQFFFTVCYFTGQVETKVVHGEALTSKLLRESFINTGTSSLECVSPLKSTFDNLEYVALDSQ